MGVMLTIGYLSDLHLEVMPKTDFERIDKVVEAWRDVDVLVVAGDFSSNMSTANNPLKIPMIVNRLFQLCVQMLKTEIVYVPGNHEYYTSSFPIIDHLLVNLSNQVTNLHVLNNAVEIIHGQRFVGTTLWFPHRKYDVDQRLADFTHIHNFSCEVEERARVASNFLVRALQPGDVLVTHHLPSHSCVAADKVNSTLNRFYVHNHAPLIEEVRPALCIHGHSHTSWDQEAEGTRYLRNPYGYAGYQVNPDFQFGASVTIGD